MDDLPCSAPTDLCSVDSMAEHLTDAIKSKAKLVGMVSKTKNKSGESKPWYDSECFLLKKFVKKSLKKCKNENFGNQKSVEQYNNNKKLYLNVQKLKKKIYKDSTLDKLSHCKESKSFWSIINGFRSRSNNKNNIDFDTSHTFFSNFFNIKETFPYY